MKSRSFHPSALAALLAVAAGAILCAGPARAAFDPLSPPQLLDPADEESMIQADPGGAGLRVVVAAPRAAFTGGGAGVLPAASRGRALNVVQGETIRFISGVREAVWFEGRGRVESLLTLALRDPAGGSTPLGRDRVLLAGAAPKIGAGLASVEAIFAAPGDFEVVAGVRVETRPDGGRPVARGRRVDYEVKVWAPGQLGSVSGFVGDAADGRPLAGLRVLALDEATLEPVSAALTRCDGTYEIHRLPPGGYLVAVPAARGYAAEFFDDAPDAASASPVGVAAGGETTGIDLMLSRAGS